jgi:tRNA U34 2-thiouridine synthase MnmA/TrmU
MKIIAAMSGGVDSAVAAARAVERQDMKLLAFTLRFHLIHRSTEVVLVDVALSKIHMMPVVLQMSSEFLSISGIWQMNFTRALSKTL